MDNRFFEQPILNSPYEYPARHWELDAQGQPTQRIIEARRKAEFITPIPKPKKHKGGGAQKRLVFDEGAGVSSATQQYDPTPIINELRHRVNQWRGISNPGAWGVTPETARLLHHWRHHEFTGVRPFFCQTEAVETAIWLIEVAPNDRHGKGFLEHLANANAEANPELMRLALKLATGAGKTTVMAMLIAWQTVNAVRRPQSKRFTRGFLVVTPGLTIKDRLRVLQPKRPGQLLCEPQARPHRHAGRRQPRQDRHHQLPCPEASRAGGALPGRPRAPPGARGRRPGHPRDRGPDVVARHAGADGAQEHPCPERRGVYRIESDFTAKVERAFDEMLTRAGGPAPAFSA
jgi:hypothetical protein